MRVTDSLIERLFKTTILTVNIPGPEENPGPTRLTGSDARRLHFTLACGLALCVAAFIFELSRALAGHSFSWLYVVEWPIFAAFGIYAWWALLQGRDRVPRVSSKDPVSDGGAEPDERLDAWNLYLQSMAADEEHDEPGGPA
jgi:hypothetical protein